MPQNPFLKFSSPFFIANYVSLKNLCKIFANTESKIQYYKLCLEK